MNVRWTVALAACTAVLLLGTSLATAAEPIIGQNQSAAPASAGIIRNSTLIGTTVLNLQSQKLGQIKDVLFDSQTGQATFVVLDAGVPGAGRAMLVVPYQALRVSLAASDSRPSVALDLRPDQVAAAPQIQNNQWQMLQNAKFLDYARNFYQPKTYTAAQSDRQREQRQARRCAAAHQHGVPAAAVLGLRELRPWVDGGVGRVQHGMRGRPPSGSAGRTCPSAAIDHGTIVLAEVDERLPR